MSTNPFDKMILDAICMVVILVLAGSHVLQQQKMAQKDVAIAKLREAVEILRSMNQTTRVAVIDWAAGERRGRIDFNDEIFQIPAGMYLGSVEDKK